MNFTKIFLIGHKLGIVVVILRNYRKSRKNVDRNHKQEYLTPATNVIKHSKQPHS